MTRPAYNAEGTPHLYATGPEAAELARLVRDEGETYTGQSKNTDHKKHPVFNPEGPQRPGVPLAVSDTSHTAGDSPALQAAKGTLREYDAADTDMIGNAAVSRARAKVRTLQGKTIGR